MSETENRIETVKAEKLISVMKLKPHQEGGYYKEMYRSEETMTTRDDRFRNVCTSIYYFLMGRQKSRFHRLKSDELWFFHRGETLEILLITEGKIKILLLGNDVENGEWCQLLIPANTWFGARIKNAQGYSLVSCTVSPGFDFADFEVASRQTLLEEFPHLEEIIVQMT